MTIQMEWTNIQKIAKAAEIIQTEKEHKSRASKDPWRLTHHLMPPAGWLNDPNGLCQKDGIYHVFFQYSPLNPEGGEKFWGHYQSQDLIHWDYMGAPLYPDAAQDRHGVYSGSAFVEDGEIYLYYTGNVKQSGNHDYILSGREANTILVTTPDGVTFSKKEFLMTNEDYGAEQSCHVRDPKVWKENGIYYMVQGARTREGQGQVLVFRSADKRNWSRCSTLRKDSLNAYMWECPDLFILGNHRILSFSPQGLPAEELRWQNQYQSGYCLAEGNFAEEGACDLGEFREWDMGFDFYAPQTFRDEQGRRILIGWMGMIDCEEDYTNAPTVKKGWQHCLTLPRELLISEDRQHVIQRPVKELKLLRETEESYEEEAVLIKETRQGMEVILISEERELSGILFDLEGLQLSYDAIEQVVTLEFTGDASKEMGSGRKVRRAPLGRLRKVQAYLDSSAAEIYLNDGEMVFSTRYYPQKEKLKLHLWAEQIRVYNLRNMEITDKIG